MKNTRLLSFAFYFTLMVMLALLGYRGYLFFSAPETDALHAEQVARIEAATQGREAVHFTVIGEANNSIGVFEKQAIADINASGADFVVSAGNAVSRGGEDNYRSLLGSLSRLSQPFLMTFGNNERTEFGSSRFYQRFGPHFYTVTPGNTRFVFLDGTGRSSASWQERWLTNLLEGERDRLVIVFLGHPLVDPLGDLLFKPDRGIWSAPKDQTRMLGLLKGLNVDAVISAGASVYSDQTVDGIRHITTGGGGGLILNNKDSFYHYLDVTTDGHDLSVDVVHIKTAPSLLMRWLESLWAFIYSLFYVSFLNFLLILSAFALIGIHLFNRLFRDRDYYPSYDAPPLSQLGRPLRVVMVTNNYFPFVGGVPISVDRLKRGLETHGHQVMVVCPSYGSDDMPDPTVERVPVLLRTRGWLLIANPFLRRTRRRIEAFKPDIIHVHHPFWLGTLGRLMARRLKIPVIYTYHTRLEHYAHQIPVPGRLFRNVIAHWLVRRFANKCDAVIVPTPVARDYMRLIGVDRPVHVQPTGIDLEEFEAPDAKRLSDLRQEVNPDGRLVFVTVSRLSPEKNIDFLIAAIAGLKQRNSKPFRFLILGEGEERQHLTEVVKAQQLDDDVTFLGNVDASIVPDYLAVSDVFVFASRSETQGMVVLEAMATGLPVVAVDSSGVDAFVANGSTGFRTPEDTVLWLNALETLIGDPDLRCRFGQSAKDVAQEHSTERFAASVALLYEGLVQTAQSGTVALSH